MEVNVLENFYENPDKIVSILNNDYPITGCGTGNRSIPLQQIDRQLYNNFCDRIYSIHKIDRTGMYLTTFFMEHEYQPIEIFNKRWVHIDGKNPNVCLMTMEDYKLVICGQIFLTPDPDPEAGINFCKLKPHVDWNETELIDNCINNYTIPRNKYDAGLITLQEYEKIHTDYHNNFDTKANVENVYNRMVSWKAGALHGEPMTKKMNKRLSQYFFIQRIKTK